MGIQEKIKDKSLLEWAFCWNQTRMVLAGATLLLAKQSPILTYFSIPLIAPLAGRFMSLAWIVSGLAAAYILYVWNKTDKTVFGGNDKKDLAAFWIATLTGLHLGIAGLTGFNIVFTVIPYVLLTPFMIISGLVYFWIVYHLHSKGGVTKMLNVVDANQSSSDESVPN